METEYVELKNLKDEDVTFREGEQDLDKNGNPKSEEWAWLWKGKPMGLLMKGYKNIFDVDPSKARFFKNDGAASIGLNMEISADEYRTLSKIELRGYIFACKAQAKGKWDEGDEMVAKKNYANPKVFKGKLVGPKPVKEGSDKLYSAYLKIPLKLYADGNITGDFYVKSLATGKYNPVKLVKDNVARYAKRGTLCTLMIDDIKTFIGGQQTTTIKLGAARLDPPVKDLTKVKANIFGDGAEIEDGTPTEDKFEKAEKAAAKPKGEEEKKEEAEGKPKRRTVADLTGKNN